jgi:flagellar hook-associated protein 2
VAAITSAGVGSGLDLESIIDASVNAEKIPKQQAILKKEQSLKVELSAVGEVKSAVSALEATFEKLADVDNFEKRSSSIRQPDSGDVISVTSSSESTPGTFDIEVKQLAQGSRAVGGAGSFSATTDVVTASGGDLIFAAGSETFTLNLTAGTTLAELREQINDASDNFGVSANIINTGTESKLVLSSSETGSGNDLVITNTTSELDAVSTVANSGVAGGMVTSADDQAKDAIITVDGIDVTSSSNTFADAIEDMTIRALKLTESGETAQVSVDVDRTSVTELIDELITNYNQVVGQIGFQTRVSRPLNGDSTLRSLQNQLVTTLSTEITGAGSFGTLFDIGIGVNKEGYLEKSSLVRSLNEAMDEEYDNIAKVFTGAGGVATMMKDLLANYVDTDGLFKQRQDDLNSRIDDVEDDKSRLDYRVSQLESRLRRQYSSLDVLLAQMQSTQASLGAALSNLPGFTREKS